jgi:hypothetical protein
MTTLPTRSASHRRHLTNALLALSAAFVLAGCDGRDPPTAGGVASEYVLEVRWLETAPTGATRTSFEVAVNIVRETITAPLNPVAIPPGFSDLGDCGSAFAGQPPVEPQTIEGLIIYILVTSIDGEGGVLGSAGPCLVRSESQNFLTALGVMQFDSADVAQLQGAGRLTDVVLHEVLHVLGFGTIWIDNGLLSGAGTADARFLGPRARTACADLHAGGTACATNVPVHSADGAGSADAHWRESLFTTELMTPFLSAGAAPFSMMTVESLGDLGYSVSGIHTDAFTVTGTALRFGAEPTGAPQIRMPEPTRPVYELDEAGALIPYRRVR